MNYLGIGPLDEATYQFLKGSSISSAIHHSEHIQSNLNSSTIDSSFTVANSDSFLVPSKVFRRLQKTHIWGFFLYYIMELYVVRTH